MHTIPIDIKARYFKLVFSRLLSEHDHYDDDATAAAIYLVKCVLDG
jgi:hypothetical protein